MAEGWTTTWTYDDLVACNTSDSTALNQFLPPGALHTVLLTGLEPGAPLWYTVGTAAGGTSEVIAHTGAPPVYPASRRTKILYVADMGAGPPREDEIWGALDPEGDEIARENAGPRSGGRHVVQAVLEHEELGEYDLVLHNGDLSYVSTK